jgi:chromosome segregation ATPase
MARPGVTYSEVSHAAQQISAAGKNPTIDALRIALGTGSNSTLGAHLRTWKARQDQTQQIATKEKLPEALIAVIKGLWETVMEQADDKVHTLQGETQQAMAKWQQEVQQLQQDTARWQQQHRQLKEERDGLMHEKSAVEQLLVNANLTLAALTEKQVGLEQQTQDKQARIEELHRQSQQLQVNLEHYREESLAQRLAEQQRFEQQQHQFEQTLQQMNQALAQVQQEKIAFQQQYQQTYFERDNLQTQFDKLTVQHESLTTRHAETLNELVTKTQGLQHWQGQYQALLAKGDEQTQLLLEVQTQQAVLVQQLATAKVELKDVREQNKVLAHEKWMLGQEKAQLFGQLKQLGSAA